MTRPGRLCAASKGWITTSSSQKLSGRRGKDTEPEILLRRALWARGVRYRLHGRVAGRFTADLVFRSYKLLVFVDGCFWHNCPRHGRPSFRGPNASLWASKMARNQARDVRITAFAKSTGWQVLRFWECKIREDPRTTAHEVLALVRRAPLQKGHVMKVERIEEK